ncbi:TPA: hypothetical protein ACIEWO_001080 [Streptococcus pyogenes]|uniref:hypothetical protein n=1 Tax=Streptococcus pyogenes TaxID=1314 RepID=UPI0010A1758B|nr:hypothetical protein [Streptococcus pyogenes]NBA05400.1 hypothetical protein [Streptococcus pyogenes]VGR18218.1 phage protein [Streptococcus pyogenes]VGR58593.1 phage protein [Streptococcus pyogenes]VGR61108.1 phage protein [Streptococcus pyogenes]VGR75196.1 phage protein [Streptococcus pyogenes]
MKKKLILTTALFTVSISVNVKADEAEVFPQTQVSQVSTEGTLKWELDPYQQNVVDDNRQPITIGISGNDISIPLPQGWSVSFRKDGHAYSPQKINNKELAEYSESKRKSSRADLPAVQAQNTSLKVLLVEDKEKTTKLGAIYNNNQGTTLTPTVTVTPPTSSPSTLSVVFRSQDGFWAGSYFLRDSQTIEKEKEEQEKKRKEEEEQQKQKAEQEKEEQEKKRKKEVEETYLKYLEYDSSKTWYQRLGESIQDQWWNFKGWLRG